ncbi:MAG: ThuA domain-containing protein [Planctomycetota bacterium]|jgi:type 1 glutamine amidotransferase
MANIRCFAVLFTAAALLLPTPVWAAQEIPEHRVKQIWDAAPEKPRVVPKEPRRVLIWITPAHLMEKDPHKGYCIPYGTCAMRTLGKKTGAFEPVVSGDVAMYLPKNIKQFDAIVMNNSSGPWITPTDADMDKDAFKNLGMDKAGIEQVLRKSLLNYVSNGGGIVAYHYAIGANRHWPEFCELLGATFTGHPWNEEVGIVVEEPGHPLVAAFDGKGFRLADEIFQYGDPYDRSKLRVLLSLDTERTNMGVKWIRRQDNDFALAWVKLHCKGRVFYTSFGHRTELYWTPQMLQFYLDAIQFATGDLDAPTAARPDRPVKRAPGPTPPKVRAAKMKARQVALPTKQQFEQIEAAAPDKAPAKPAKPRNVLVWGRVWTHQPNPFAEKALEILGKKTGVFRAVVSDDPRLLLADRLGQFDALVMNNIHQRDPFLPEDFVKLDPQQQTAAKKLDEAVKQSILEFVRGGKGIVGIHAATAALQNWPEYGEMMGGYYGGHIYQEVTIRLDDPQHPVNACLGGKPWRINDEIYISREPYSRKKLRVLLSLDLDRMADPEKRPDKDYAVSWVRQYGNGRVFYTTLGHAAETYWNPLFLEHVLAGIQFAIGDLPGEMTPSAGKASEPDGTGTTTRRSQRGKARSLGASGASPDDRTRRRNADRSS